MRYAWILFDADDTLFDYVKAEETALQGAFEQLALAFDPSYISTYRQINGQIWQAFERGEITQQVIRWRRFELLLEAIGLEADPDTLSAAYLEHLGNSTTLIDGAQHVVCALRGQVGLALITNGLQEVQQSRLAQSTIHDCFDAVIISEQVGASKPHPAIFEAACARMSAVRQADVQKREILIVGDSLTSDIKGGNNYGIDTCWFNPRRKPRSLDVEIQYEIRRLSELLDIVLDTVECGRTPEE